ncbi:MAG: hypothetical protein SFU56_00345 [Capsulimonadales bacterium]|nr:hypothetical protein [Capsulimonadales bacterium]
MQSTTPLFDFTTDAGRQGWQATHDIAALKPDPNGLRIEANGGDPYTVGPPVTVPANIPLWLTVRLTADRNGLGQIFHFRADGGPSEPDSVRFAVRGGRPTEIKVPLPPLPAPTMRFRFDPPGGAGDATVISRMDVTPRVLLTEPTWPTPTVPTNAETVVQTVLHGPLAVKHAEGWGHFAVGVDGQLFAVGNNRPYIGYQTRPDAPLQWMDARYVPDKGFFSWKRSGESVTGQALDADGGLWTFEQRIDTDPRPGVLRLRLTLTVSADRFLAFFPLLTLFCGMGGFGTKKAQGLFAGVEYLDAPDTSSSEADLRGEQSQRQMPLPHMLTLPLMALVQGGRWLALAWEPTEWVAPYFDTPDRRFGSGGQVMALHLPGNLGDHERPPGGVLPYASRLLKANTPLVVRATLLGGTGTNVTEAVKAYVALTGLPKPPATYSVPTVAHLLASGWLSSRIRVGNAYRHAYPGDFGAGPAADAALCQAVLARLLGVAPNLVAELTGAARTAIRQVPSADRAFSGIGHVRTFAAPLVHGKVPENLDRVRQRGREALTRFRPDGTVRYEKTAERPDFGSTHFADHANGISGEAIATVLEAAVLTGDPELRRNGLAVLKRVAAAYRDSVPRGAQTWEVPLHTPDILASAHLVRAFVLGYELSGQRTFLEQARYWAWTGVPFTYLRAPVPEHPVGVYATTPVLGATHWVAPNWIGLPVQWCGLVYANALYDLAVHDPQGIWKRLADGIVVSGIQQTWPAAGSPGSDRARQGLLPDSFHLPGQIRNDVAINPATQQVPYLRSIGRPLYERRMLAPGGPFVHAPGRIVPVPKPPKQYAFTVTGWPDGPYQVLVTGLTQPPIRVMIGSERTNAAFRREGGRLILTVRGKATVTIVQERA